MIRTDTSGLATAKNEKHDCLYAPAAECLYAPAAELKGEVVCLFLIILLFL